jgi:hypothetical protein
MRKAKRVSQKRTQVAREPQHQAKRINRKQQNAATSGLHAASQSIGEFNNGFREIADEVNEYSIRSVENVFRAWQQFLDARPLRQVVEYQTRCAQNAYEAYITEFSRLGDLCISLTRRASEPLRQVSRRS